MKKVYEKPSIYVEAYEMSQHIANSCSYNYRTLTSADTCYAIGEDPYMGVIKVLLDSNEKCDVKYSGYCEFNGTDPVVVATST